MDDNYFGSNKICHNHGVPILLTFMYYSVLYFLNSTGMDDILPNKAPYIPRLFKVSTTIIILDVGAWEMEGERGKSVDISFYTIIM